MTVTKSAKQLSEIVSVVSLCFFVLSGCGKAEIAQDCTLSGKGDVTCNFHNTGNAKGSICISMMLVPKPNLVSFNKEQGWTYSAGEWEASNEICSGIVEAGDVREAHAFVTFGEKKLAPQQKCGISDDWKENCSYEIVKKTN